MITKMWVTITRPIISLLLLVAMLDANAQDKDFPELVGPYLGQQPPGESPVVFAPGVVSTRYRVYGNVTFNPGVNEACWTPNTDDSTYYHGGLLISRVVDGVWTEPKEIRLLGDGYSHRSPYYGLDGKHLYFQAYDTANKGWDQREKFYYAVKNDTGWSSPTLLDSIFDNYAVHWQFSVDAKNNLYFGGDLRGRENTGGIYFSEYQNGSYKEPVLILRNSVLDEAVFAPAISPEGDYLLFARIHPRGSKNPRIFSVYVCFRNAGNGWTTPQDVGEVLHMDANQPRISPDGNYIFFVGNDGMVYWVSAAIIEAWRPRDHND